MRKIITAIILTAGLLSAGNRLAAQSKTGCISFNELLNAMPDFKRADTVLARYRDTLEREYDAYKTEYSEQENLLRSVDTARYTKVQLDLKKRSLAEILSKLQGYEQEAGLLLDQKRQFLLLPIQKKAAAAIQAVSKENGYAFILEKDVLHVYPPSEDILPLVKKRLGLL
jgi:outer membrane protein